MEAIRYYLSNAFSESMLSLLKDNSIVSITDSLGRIEYASDNFCKILECDVHKLIGETHALLKSHLHTGKLYKNLWSTIKMGNKWHGILSDTSPSGKQFWLETTIIPIKDDAENTSKYVAIYKDITENYTKNVELLERNITHENFLKNMPLHVFSITKRGKILNANKSYCNREITELIGTYIYDYINPSSFEIFKKGIDAVFIDKTPNQFETFYYDSKGEKIVYSTVASPVFNELGGIVSATIAIHVFTKHHEKRENFDENERKYRTIYQSINVGIIVVADNKGNITEWNKGAELAFGYSELEILGRPLTVLISKKFRKGNIKELLKAIKKIKSNQNIDTIEMCCLRKNGEEFPVEFALSNWNDEDDNGFYCAMMLDISKRKTLENKLKQKTKDLEMFLYRSAHDLKAPFSSAEGLLNLLKEEKEYTRVVSLTDMLDTIIKSGKDLSESLSQASNIFINKKEFKKINFSETINNVLILLSGTSKIENIKFNIDVVDAFSYHSNPELIDSIFQNLIQNAIKYSIEPEADYNPYINIIVKTAPEGVEITIEDNGVGIDKKNIDKIFDLYYRANKQGVSGNGLGLYIVKNIVDDLKGKIIVKSDIKRGSSFKIILPNTI